MKQAKKNEHVDFGFIDIPSNYGNYDNNTKIKICDEIIDRLYKKIDKHLAPQYDRIQFLDEIFLSSLMVNEEDELYEICTVLRDCRKRLNED